MTRKSPAPRPANRPFEKPFNRETLAKPSRIDRRPKRQWGRGRP